MGWIWKDFSFIHIDKLVKEEEIERKKQNIVLRNVMWCYPNFDLVNGEKIDVFWDKNTFELFWKPCQLKKKTAIVNKSLKHLHLFHKPNKYKNKSFVVLIYVKELIIPYWEVYWFLLRGLVSKHHIIVTKKPSTLTPHVRFKLLNRLNWLKSRVYWVYLLWWDGLFYLQ